MRFGSSGGGGEYGDYLDNRSSTSSVSNHSHASGLPSTCGVSQHVPTPGDQRSAVGPERTFAGQCQRFWQVDPFCKPSSQTCSAQPSIALIQNNKQHDLLPELPTGDWLYFITHKIPLISTFLNPDK
uniref:(northern house mosquito) hypothetical protein n=1 Tax=Culex pipiens TaxID=7175 RepID=A0A8D8BF56_CULPI